VAEPNLTFNGSVLTDNGDFRQLGYHLVNTTTDNNVSASQNIISFSTDLGCSAFFEYCITRNNGAKRMGQVYVVWDGGSAESTDVSSPDLNGSTSDFIWKVTVSASTLYFDAAIGSGTWNILVHVRVLISN